jgi:prepilin-type N-terminal cleavage/methylation domain-containing protein
MRLRRCAAAAGRRLAAERGYTLSEMVVVLAILGIVIAALTQLFVSASIAQVDMTRRFEAQQEMRLALDKLRREIHCANGVAGAPPTSSIVITLGSYCPTHPSYGTTPPPPPVDVTWCVKDRNGQPPPGVGAPYSLWRQEGACTPTGGRKQADFLTTGQVFTAYAPPTAGSGSLGKLSVHLPVDVDPADAKQRYVLKDDIVLRNTPRQ